MQFRGDKLHILSAIFGVWSTLLFHAFTLHATELPDTVPLNKYGNIYYYNTDSLSRLAGKPLTDSVACPDDTITLPRRELLAVKTNMLFYAAYIPGYGRWCPIPNIAVEYYPRSGHFTYGFSFDMPWWQHYNAHKYFQLRNYQLETRYYFRSSSPLSQSAPGGFPAGSVSPAAGSAPAFSGLYLSAYAHAGVFGICFDENRGWVGEGWGAGLGMGYVTPISRNGHWRLEFQLQAGYFRCKYDPYRYENPVNPAYHDDLYYYKWTQKPEFFHKRQYRWNWLGPTRIGITLSYDLLYRKAPKPHPQPLPQGEGSINHNSQNQ